MYINTVKPTRTLKRTLISIGRSNVFPVTSPSTKEENATIRKNERIQSKIGALFDHRYLFVQKELTPKERETLKKITLGLPELRKLREIVDEVYGLYDRRCRRTTALNKLRKLRERLKRFRLPPEINRQETVKLR